METKLTEFTKDELIYLHNCTGAHKYVLRPNNPYPDELEQIYYSVRSKMSQLIKEAA
jgi:hypothetical protein